MVIFIIVSNICFWIVLLSCVLLATPFTRISPFTQVRCSPSQLTYLIVDSRTSSDDFSQIFSWGCLNFFFFCGVVLQMATVGPPSAKMAEPDFKSSVSEILSGVSFFTIFRLFFSLDFFMLFLDFSKEQIWILEIFVVCSLLWSVLHHCRLT